MSQNLSSATVEIGALRVKEESADLYALNTKERRVVLIKESEYDQENMKQLASIAQKQIL